MPKEGLILILGYILILFTQVCHAESGVSSSDPKIPIQAWVHDPVIQDVKVNFSGTNLAALTLPKIDEPPQITVWETKDLSKSPIRFGLPCKPECLKPLRLGWLSNDYLYVIGRKIVDIQSGGKTVKTFDNDLVVISADGKKHARMFNSRQSGWDLQIANVLRHQPNKFLVKKLERNGSEEFYEFSLKTMRSKRVFRGASDKTYILDPRGNIVGFKDVVGSGDKVRIQTWLKNPKTDELEHHFDQLAKSRSGYSDIQFAANQVYVKDNSGRDTDVLRPYDLLNRKAGKALYSHPEYDIGHLILSPLPKEDTKIIGYTVNGPSEEQIYTDDRFSKIQQNLESVLGAGSQHEIYSVSDDLGMVVIYSHGPTQPGTYYLLVGGRSMVPLGERYPQLTTEALSPVKFIHYKARDGLEIPAFLTIPKAGKAPYPTIIMPHGGPWARDRLDWDQWAQFLANRGYMVLQPQYRGSMGFGKKLWIAGDREWGNKMQDDKDDGAAWLVKKGLADKDRLAIFGYSYGGYAAMVAAVRKDSPYQCAIAGAGLSELRTFDKLTYENHFLRYFQNPTVAGLSPLDHAKEAHLPILIFHGDRDQRVPVEQSRKFYEALKSAGKEVEYIEITDLWHSFPWWPQHQYAILENLENYLATQCGPGGL